MALADAEPNDIDSKIYLIRDQKVMSDEDLGRLYQVPTMRLNEQVKRNPRRFPPDFMFQLSDQEFRALKSQNAIANVGRGGRRTPPFAFTEQGIAMLSSVLHSDRAIDVNIVIMRAFVRLRQVLQSNQEFEKRMGELEAKSDAKFKIVFDALRKIILAKSIPHRRIIGLSSKDE
jgi:hypothetical protein